MYKVKRLKIEDKTEDGKERYGTFFPLLFLFLLCLLPKSICKSENNMNGKICHLTSENVMLFYLILYRHANK